MRLCVQLPACVETGLGAASQPAGEEVPVHHPFLPLSLGVHSVHKAFPVIQYAQTAFILCHSAGPDTGLPAKSVHI